VKPSFASAAACLRLAGVIRFRVPSSLSLPQRPQLESGLPTLVLGLVTRGMESARLRAHTSSETPYCCRAAGGIRSGLRSAYPIKKLIGPWTQARDPPHATINPFPGHSHVAEY
jgi:hypothetical protein